MITSMYCLYVGVDYTYIDVNALAQGIKSFFGLTCLVSSPMLGLEPMAPIPPQLLVSHANHSATETCMYVCMYSRMHACICMYVHMHMSNNSNLMLF